MIRLPAATLRRIRRLSPVDALAVAVLLGAVVYLSVYRYTAVIEDYWYHLALGHWMHETKRIFLFDPISWQPWGRPQLYPPLVHVFVALGEALLRGPIAGANLVRILLYVGNLGAAWWVGRRYAGPVAGFVALCLLASDQSLFYSAWSLMPASYVSLVALLLVPALDRKRWIVAGLLLFSAFMAHIMFPWLLLLGVLLMAWALPDRRRATLKAAALGVALSVPWTLHLLLHTGALNFEKANSAMNPIPGYRIFGYASHYHLSVLILAPFVFSFFLAVTGKRRWLGTAFAAASVLAVLGIGVPGKGEEQWHALALYERGKTGLPVSLHEIWARLPFHIGTILAAIALVGGVALGAAALARRKKQRDVPFLLFIALLLGLFPALPFYGGRYFWHAGPLMAVVAVLPLAGAKLETWRTSRWLLALWAALSAAAFLKVFLPGTLEALTIPASIRPLALALAVAVVVLIIALRLRGAKKAWPLLPAGIAALPLTPLLLASLSLSWPLFAYSRGWRQDLLPQKPPLLLAKDWGKTGPGEGEDPDFRNVVAYVESHAAPEEIIHSDDPRTGHMVTIFANRVTDTGMFWEAVPKELQDKAEARRLEKRGVYVYIGTLPEGIEPEFTYGKWKVATVREVKPDPAALPSV